MVVPTAAKSNPWRSRGFYTLVPLLIVVVVILNLVLTYQILLRTTWNDVSTPSRHHGPYRTIDEESQAWWNQRRLQIQAIRRQFQSQGSDDVSPPTALNTRQQQFLAFDPSMVSHYNLSCGGSSLSISTTSSSTCVHTVHVGHQGSAVVTAITHGFFQRRVGYPRKYFDMVATSHCLSTNNETATTTYNGSILQQRRRPTTITTTTTKWKTHLPHAMLIGVQKAGTTALYNYLDQHPHVTRTNKEIYFLDEQVDEMVIANGGKGIPQRQAQQLYSRFMSQSFLKEKNSSSKDDEKNHTHVSTLSPQNDTKTRPWHHPQPPPPTFKMILDLTPHYILESDRIPARISCLVPWVKLLVLLRNPIDRARSQYDMKMGVKHKKKKIREKQRNHFGYPIPSFDEYIRNDIAALQETGVIQDWNKIPFETFWDTPAMWEAWRTYLHSGLNAPVGMGLYALQLQPFLDLPNDLLVIRSEDLKADSNATFQKVLEFLKLPAYELPSYPLANHAQHPARISPLTQNLLQHVLEPFNRKLEDLLGEEWHGVWQS